MSQPTQHPTLTPRFCFNQSALRDFLRLSRASIDDSITSQLNSLLTPSTQPFNPRTPSPRPTTRTTIPATQCATFTTQILFPAWQARSDVLAYCGGVATSPDPDDPEHLLREHEDAVARERVVDERLDPYSARYVPREGRAEVLAGLVRNERMVERIVRERTWKVVGERCEGVDGVAEEAFERWRKGR